MTKIRRHVVKKKSKAKKRTKIQKCGTAAAAAAPTEKAKEIRDKLRKSLKKQIKKSREMQMSAPTKKMRSSSSCAN